MELVASESRCRGRKLPYIVVGCLLVAVWLAPSSPVRAGGWTQPEGQFYLKVWDRVLDGDSAYLADGETMRVPAFTDHAVNLYGEYGVTSEWTLVLNATPYGHASVEGGKSTSYVGPTTVGVRRGLYADVLHLAVEGRYAYTPSIGETNLLPPLTNVPTDPISYVPTLSGHRGELELQAGVGFPYGWATAGVGYRHDSAEGTGGLLIGNAQVGASFWRIALDIHATVYEPTEKVVATNIPGAGRTRFVGLGYGISGWVLDWLGLTLAQDGVLFAESNAATPALQVGIQVRTPPQ